jgi:hypothetical protein
MVLQSASIIFNDTCSRFNKDLVDYLRRNIETAIRKGGVTFQFKIAQTADLAGLRRRGIKALPAMIIGNQNFVGVPDIVAELRKRVKNSSGEVATKTDEEIINDYQMQSLYDNNVKKNSDGKFDVTNEPDKDESEELKAALNREIRRRGASAGHGEEEDDEPKQTRARNPSRNTARDDEFEMEDDAPPPRRRPANQQRPDNLEEDKMDEARQSLRRIGKNATGDDVQDDTMMQALLDRMGGD